LLTHRQTNKQTNRQTKTGKNITSLAEVTMVLAVAVCYSGHTKNHGWLVDDWDW